jgi:hypothetical protein
MYLVLGLVILITRGSSRKKEGDFNHQKFKFWYSRKWKIRKRRGRASNPEKMSKNGPVVAEIL